MLNKHAQLGIAQIVFYVPIVPLAIYLLIRNWSYRPRMAWWPMVPLSLSTPHHVLIDAEQIADHTKCGLPAAHALLHWRRNLPPDS
jgi:hypothetical protein